MRACRPILKKVIDDNSGRKLAPFAIKVWDRIELDGEKVMHSKPKNKFVQLQRRGNREVQAEGAAGVRSLQEAAGRRRRSTAPRSWPKSKPWRRSTRSRSELTDSGFDALTRETSMAEERGRGIRPTDPIGRTLFWIAVSPGDYRRAVELRHGGHRDGQRDRALSLHRARFPATTTSSASCAAAPSSPFCLIANCTRGNVLVDFFTLAATPRVKAALDAFGNAAVSRSRRSCSPGGSITASSRCGSPPK